MEEDEIDVVADWPPPSNWRKGDDQKKEGKERECIAKHDENEIRQVLYEQLGAPVVLYRNGPYYLNGDCGGRGQAEPWGFRRMDGLSGGQLRSASNHKCLADLHADNFSCARQRESRALVRMHHGYFQWLWSDVLDIQRQLVPGNRSDSRSTPSRKESHSPHSGSDDWDDLDGASDEECFSGNHGDGNSRRSKRFRRMLWDSSPYLFVSMAPRGDGTSSCEQHAKHGSLGSAPALLTNQKSLASAISGDRLNPAASDAALAYRLGRTRAAPEYVAPFSKAALRHAAQPHRPPWEQGSQRKTAAAAASIGQRHREQARDRAWNCHPKDFSNCLVLLSLPGLHASDSATATANSSDSGSHESRLASPAKMPRYCLLYPVGFGRSRIALSQIHLPMLTSNSSPHNGGCMDDGHDTEQLQTDTMRAKHSFSNESPPSMLAPVDVGGQILQLAQHGTTALFENDSTGVASYRTTVIARTKTHVSILQCNARVKSNTEQRHTDSKPETATPSFSPIQYSIAELGRIPHKCQGGKESDRWYPVHVASPAFPQSPTQHQFSPPAFAIVYHQFEGMHVGQNVIHHVTLPPSEKSEAIVRPHVVRNLQTISAVEFTGAHPLTLWCAATSQALPRFRRYKTHPLMGVGRNIYAVDLRCEAATLSWSPSFAEKSPQSMYSVSAMLPDSAVAHRLYVVATPSPTSGSVYELDMRMPPKVVCQWSLPGLCDGLGSTTGPGGMMGCGHLLCRPMRVDCDHDFWSDGSKKNAFPLLALSKSPGSYSLGLFQNPSSFPRFHLSSLEVAGGVANDAGKRRGRGEGDCTSPQHVSTARSSVFALADSTESTFTCGLAAFQVPINALLSPEAVTELRYQKSPENALCVVTATSAGDLYGHCILACDAGQPSRAKPFEGLAVGSSAVSVPPSQILATSRLTAGETGDSVTMRNAILWTHSNKFPVPSQAFSRHVVKTRSDCRKFHAVRLESVFNGAAGSYDEHDGCSVKKPRSYPRSLYEDQSDVVAHNYPVESHKLRFGSSETTRVEEVTSSQEAPEDPDEDGQQKPLYHFPAALPTIDTLQAGDVSEGAFCDMTSLSRHKQLTLSSLHCTIVDERPKRKDTIIDNTNVVAELNEGSEAPLMDLTVNDLTKLSSDWDNGESKLSDDTMLNAFYYNEGDEGEGGLDNDDSSGAELDQDE